MNRPTDGALFETSPWRKEGDSNPTAPIWVYLIESHLIVLYSYDESKCMCTECVMNYVIIKFFWQRYEIILMDKVTVIFF